MLVRLSFCQHHLYLVIRRQIPYEHPRYTATTLVHATSGLLLLLVSPIRQKLGTKFEGNKLCRKSASTLTWHPAQVLMNQWDVEPRKYNSLRKPNAPICCTFNRIFYLVVCCFHVSTHAIHRTPQVFRLARLVQILSTDPLYIAHVLLGTSMKV